jgi:hypothetical protein
MQRQDKVLSVIFAVIGVVALVATWSQNIAFFTMAGNGGLIGFVKGGYVNPAAASLSNDLLLVAVAAMVWMVVEARRLGIPRAWIYVLLGFIIAISVSYPTFLIVRQRKLASLRSSESRAGPDVETMSANGA